MLSFYHQIPPAFLFIAIIGFGTWGIMTLFSFLAWMEGR